LQFNFSLFFLTILLFCWCCTGRAMQTFSWNIDFIVSRLWQAGADSSRSVCTSEEHRTSHWMPAGQLAIISSTPWARKKCGTLLFSISSPIIDRFSKFLHWHTLWTVCNSVIITYPAASWMHLYTTLWNIRLNIRKTNASNKHLGKWKSTSDQRCSELFIWCWTVL